MTISEREISAENIVCIEFEHGLDEEGAVLRRLADIFDANDIESVFSLRTGMSATDENGFTLTALFSIVADELVLP